MKYAILITLCYVAASWMERPFGDFIKMKLVKQAIQERVEKGYNQHIVAAFVDKTGVSFSFAGRFDSSPEDAVFEIGSLTKLFTAHLALLLEKEGIIALDAPIETYLKDVYIPQYESCKITLSHLLSHTSGLKDPYIEHYCNPLNGNTVPFADYSVAQLYDYLNETDLEFSPGSQVLYSNAGYGLIGHIFEVVTGKEYFSLLKEKILDPLGMDATFIEIPLNQSKYIVQGSEGGNKTPHWDIPHFPAFGALKSTARDLSVYLRLFLMEPHDDICKQMTTISSAHDCEGIWMCLGWTIDRRYDGNFFAATGQTLGLSSFVGFSSERNEGMILLTDASQLDHLGHYWFNPRFSLAQLQASIPVTEGALDAFKGAYSNKDGLFLEIDIGDKCLILQPAGEAPLNLYPKDQNQFFSKNLAHAVEAVRFERQSGKIVSLVIIQEGIEFVFEREEDISGY